MAKPPSQPRSVVANVSTVSTSFNIETADVEAVVKELQRIVACAGELEDYYQRLCDRLEEIRPTLFEGEKSKVKKIEANIGRSGSRIVSERA